MRPVRQTIATIHCVALAILGLQLAALEAQQASTAPTGENSPSFEVASIKPTRPDEGGHGWNSASSDRVVVKNYTLRRLIRTVYDLKSDSQVLGGPDWIGKQAFDIDAKYGDEEIAKLQKMTGREMFHQAQLAMQALLADRFQLQISQQRRSIPVYALVAVRTGAKLSPSPPQFDENGKPRAEKIDSIHTSPGHMTAKAISMSGLADWFAYVPDCDRVVIDRTGLAGEYDFKIDWTQDDGHGVPPDAPLPGLFTALREQLGLELRPEKAPVDTVVVVSAKVPEFD